MRALALSLLAVAAVAGCSAPACKSGTVFVSVTLSDSAATADSLAIDVQVAGGGDRGSTVALKGRHEGSFEVDFSKYPAGKSVTVSITALSGAQVVGTASQSLTLDASCGHLAIAIGSGVSGVDGGVSNDLAGSDFAGCMTNACPADTCGAVADGCGGMLDCGACELLSMSPAIAQVGTAVTLEGRFNPGATINFPGGVSAPATLLGPNRATAVVPAGATTGNVSVTTGGSAVGAVSFRTTSFAPGFGFRHTQYEQGGYGRAFPTFTTMRIGGAMIATSSYVYALGGNAPGGSAPAGTTIERAAIHADDTFDPLQPISATLTSPHGFVANVVAGNRVYLLGGYDQANSKLVSVVEQADINSDGTLGAFADSGVALQTARQGASAVVVGTHLYVIGGTDSGGAPLSSIESATIDGSGKLSSFSVLTSSALATARSRMTVVLTATSLYVLGGYTTAAQLDSIEKATVNADGTLGAFSLVTAKLTTTRAGATALVLGNTVTLIAGDYAQDNNDNTVEVATINADGTLGAFANSGRWTWGRSDASTFVIGNWAYTMGGDTVETQGERASIDLGGKLASLVVDPTVSAATNRAGACSVVVGRRLFVIGGRQPGNGFSIGSVDQANINADGTLAPFTVAKAAFGGATFPACFATPHWVYVIGGLENAVTTGDVQRAPIEADGTLGAFAAAPFYDSNGVPVAGSSISLINPRAYHSVVLHGKYVYVIGGLRGDGASPGVQGSTEVATLVNENLSTFATSGSLLTPRYGHASIWGADLSSDKLFVFGGQGSASGGAVTTIEQSPFGGSLSFANLPSGSTFGNVLARFLPLALGNEIIIVNDDHSASTGNEIDVALFTGVLGGNFTASGSTVAATRTDIGSNAIILGNHIYVYGGGTTSVESAVLP